MRRLLALVAVALLLPTTISGCADKSTQESPSYDYVFERAVDDYPEWDVVSVSSSGSRYTVRLEHKSRELSISSEYTQWPGYLFSSEQVLRKGAPFPEGSEELLDFLEENYAADGKSIGLVAGGPEGLVEVSWSEIGWVLVFPVRQSRSEYLEFSETRSEWATSDRLPGTFRF